jgi:ABC-type transport system involved in multi-copper enzyme maturation permease subunit
MPAALLARSVMLEARRGGLPWIAAAALVVAVALAAFLAQVAITEGAALQAAVLGAVLRACAVFLVAAQVASSTMREIHDKGLELMLSLPLSRSTHYLGRLAGFVACGVAISLAFALAMTAWAAPAAAALWGVSLALELALVAAAALFFAMTLSNLVAAIAATAGLYLLARAMPAIQSIAARPLAEESWAGWLARHAVDTIALVLPRLDAATRSEWLVYGADDMRAYGSALAALVVYFAVLTAAGLVDFHRRSA